MDVIVVGRPHQWVRHGVGVVIVRKQVGCLGLDATTNAIGTVRVELKVSVTVSRVNVCRRKVLIVRWQVVAIVSSSHAGQLVCVFVVLLEH